MAGQTGAAARPPVAKPPVKKKKKKRVPVGKIILYVLLLILVGVAAVFLVYVGKYVYSAYQEMRNPTTAAANSFPLTSYSATNAANKDKVGYYIVGLTGADAANDDMQMLSMVCFDKVKKTVNILEIPQSTYLSGDDWAVNNVAGVWPHPKDIDWCDTCKERVPAGEIVDGKHTVCGTPITKKAGSATSSLAELFNQQYGLPVDGYFILSQSTLTKLVDLCGGVDIELDAPMTVGTLTYKAGVQTLDGKAALQYVTATAGSDIAGDIGRMPRFDQVFVALMQRMAILADNDLTANVIAPLMNSSAPIRVDENTDNAAIVALIRALADVSYDDMTAYLIPGGTAKSDGNTYYSVDKAALVELINQHFNPYSDPLTEGNCQLTELTGAKAVKSDPQVLSAYVISQTGEATTTAAPTTATTVN